MQADIISGVVMDIAAFKVSHSVGTDKDATSLRAARERSEAPQIGALHGVECHRRLEDEQSAPSPNFLL